WVGANEAMAWAPARGHAASAMVRSRIGRVRRAVVIAPARAPTAIAALSRPTPPGPEWNSFLAMAARVTGRLIVKNPKVPTMTVGHSTEGVSRAYRRPWAMPMPRAMAARGAWSRPGRIRASAVSGATKL